MKNSTTILESLIAPTDTIEMMEAYQLVGPKTIQRVEVEIPEPGPNEVRIKLEGCGLCASSIAVWEGRPWFNYPVEAGNPGHEGYGIIDKVGENVEDLKEGDRVTGLVYNAYASFDIAKADEVVKIPETLKYMPLPGEPLGCAMNIFRRSEIKKDQHVAIIGAGFLGSLLIQLAHKAGARVYAISKRPHSLSVAKEMGADEVLQLSEKTNIEEKISKLTAGKGCDCVIEATGKQSPLELATKIIGTRGKIVIAGYHQDGLRQVDMQTWNWKGIDVINAHERDPQEYIRGIKEAISAIESCTFDVTPLFTHYYTPDKINEAFENLVNRPEGYVKGIMLFN